MGVSAEPRGSDGTLTTGPFGVGLRFDGFTQSRRYGSARTPTTPRATMTMMARNHVVANTLRGTSSA